MPGAGVMRLPAPLTAGVLQRLAVAAVAAAALWLLYFWAVS